MFNKESLNEKKQFIIVYNKQTKSIAKSLSNELAGKINCVTWSKNDFLGNEAKLKNSNKILFYDDDLIKENFLTAEINIKVCDEMVSFIKQGNVAALRVNYDNITPKKMKKIQKHSGMIGAGALTGLLLLSGFGVLGGICGALGASEIEKRIRFMLLKIGTKEIQKELLPQFINE